MLSINWVAVLATALVPLVVGSIYYSPMLFANAWMRASGLAEADLKGANMVKIFGFALLLGLLLAVSMVPLTLHANHVYSIVAQAGGGPVDPTSQEGRDAADFLAKYGHNFRTFKHGAFHGLLGALFTVWPVLGVSALFERRGWRYTAIHLGYWAIVFALMGGLVCAFA